MNKQKIKFVALGVFLLLTINSYAAPSPANVTNFIKVDQFGYKTWDIKIAAVSDPQTGYNESLSYTPGTTYQIRNWTTDAVVYTGTLTPWNIGAEHSQSGDKVWWFTFTDLQTTGSYYVYDTSTGKASVRFEIKNQPFQDAMKAAMKMLFYQRSGQVKSSTYAGVWADPVASHPQDQYALPAPLYQINPQTNQEERINPNAQTQKDLRGGWFDAGDYNKYVNYIWHPMLDLLLAYEQRPSVWAVSALNLNIPESNNTIPDILDEVKYELDWLLKMQAATGNGSVLSVVGTEHYATASPPSADRGLAANGQGVDANGVNHTRYYGPATTLATYTAAGVFALASIQFRAIGQTAYANTLLNAGNSAWNWATNPANANVKFNNNTGDTHGNGSNIINYVAAGNQEYGNGADWAVDPRHFTAAVYLYAAAKAANVTPNAAYQLYIDNNYNNGNVFNSTVGASYDTLPTCDALLYYAKTTGATTTVKNNILLNYTNSMTNGPNNLPRYYDSSDAYMAYISYYKWQDNEGNPVLDWVSEYDWGSNLAVAHQADNFLNMYHYYQTLDPSRRWTYYNAAAGYLHYFHGVNPNAKVYMTNMGQYGAENSVTSIYHGWFHDGHPLYDQVGVSTYGPPPGYVPGGPNQFYEPDPECANVLTLAECNQNITPPMGQPPQKAWKDFNTSWPINSWTVTEPQIYMQAAYIRLLSKFM